MKNDTISRKAAIDAFKKELTVVESKGNYVTICSAVGYKGAKQILERLPSAQPEIIRCKDCLMHGVCRFEQGLGLDGYCSQAERRIDE